MAPGVTIEVFKGAGSSYYSELNRRDGVVIRLEGGSWNKIAGAPGRVPHDIAHVVVESELGLTRGLWGVLAAGGIVQNASVISGRQAARAIERAEAVVAPARESLRQAEIVVRAVTDLSLAATPADEVAFRRATGERWKIDASAEQLSRACARLEGLAREWGRLDSGSSLTLVSPDY